MKIGKVKRKEAGGETNNNTNFKALETKIKKRRHCQLHQDEELSTQRKEKKWVPKV